MWKAFQELEILGWIGSKRPRMVSVQAEGCAPMVKAFQDGLDHAEPWPDAHTIADGLRTSLCDRTYNIIRKLVNEIITVSEREILEGMKFLWERLKTIVEPSGAVPLAALLSHKIETKGKKIGVIISGGNVMLDDFFNSLEKKISS